MKYYSKQSSANRLYVANLSVSSGSFGFCVYQKGIVLVLSLLILLVLTIIGVAAMNSTMMQERMAGNTRTQTLAFEEASGGVSRALEFFYEHIEQAMDDNDVSDPYGYGMACGFVHGDEDMHWNYPSDGSFLAVSENDRLRMDQRMYCCQNWVYNEDDETCYETPSTLFVLSRGSFLNSTDNGNRLATREIEVRLRESDPPDPTCAICMPGPVGEVDPPNAGGGVHGSCGPAITVDDQLDANDIAETWADASNSELTGGVAAGDMGSPWNSPMALAEFVFWAKLGAEVRSDIQYVRHEEIPSGAGSDRYGTGGNQSVFGTLENPQITYFDNRLDKPVPMHSDVQGAGIMIVRGQVRWGGTPGFRGLIVVLGGKYETYAGGGGPNKGGMDGSMVVTNLEPTVSPSGYEFLGGPEVLQFPVAKDADGNIEFHEGLPVLQANNPTPFGTTRVHFDGRDSSGNPVLLDEAGNTLPWVWAGEPGQSDIVLDTGQTPPPRLAHEPARDKFGRLIPDFLMASNWPAEEFGFSPNEWRWDPPDPDALPFDFGISGSDLLWTTGGGGQTFTYDCRMLHRMRHRLLCEQKQSGHNPDLNVNDDFYEDPDHSQVCRHPVADYEYFNDGLFNQFAWHIWQPKCDCMGITVDTDMILTGWRENLGWRDENEFLGCESLTKAARCPVD